jgi:chaperone modulatory protein CbpM
MWINDFDMDESLTCDFVAETTGTRRSLVLRLAKQGLIETVPGEKSETGDPVLPRRSIVRVRRMQRLHHDLGVNFAGAAIILDLVERITQLNQELASMRRDADKLMSDEL